ncbi:MAG: hypothetical protein LBD85_00135 [Oscillospiraceae bacterium]|jgi:hypothetical protein|nr:hypothetical protein [Oscillospiraceae bacterium]
MARSRTPVSVNGIEFDALLDDSRSLTNQVPSYPVESGFSVSDTIIHDPETLSMTLFLTESAVDFRNRGHGGSGWVSRVIKQLEDLYFSGELVTVTTSGATYTDMAIVDISISISDGNGYSKEVAISFQKVETVSSKTTTIPDSYGKSGTTGANAGSASTSVSDTPAATSGSGGAGGSSSGSESGSKGSILYNLGEAAYNLAISAGMF